jgi:hypothetical protein
LLPSRCASVGSTYVRLMPSWIWTSHVIPPDVGICFTSLPWRSFATLRFKTDKDVQWGSVGRNLSSLLTLWSLSQHCISMRFKLTVQSTGTNWQFPPFTTK